MGLGTEAQPASASSVATAAGPRAWAAIRNVLPEGRGLPPEEWQIRHRAVQFFLLAHAVGLAIFGLARGWAPGYAIGESALLALIAAAAGWPGFTRKLRSGLAAMGCVLSSAILVQFWGGVIEAHFHFFVVVALISLYQDWVPFTLAIVFVALEHGLVGVLLPTWVYNHPAAIAHPWTWAAIHAVLVLAECAALVVVWRANEQARATTERILRSTGEGLLGVDGDCNITFANPAALAMVGGTESEALRKPLYALLRSDDGRPAFAPDVLKTTPGSFTSQAWLKRPDGTRMPVEVLCTPIEGHAHEEGAVVAMRDLTERLQAEENRHLARTQQAELDHLRAVDSFKTRFMNMAAHELSTPLTPIKLQMHLLKSHSEDPQLETHKRSIQLLDRSFQRLSGLVGDLLDSSRLQSDRMPVRRQPVDLAVVLGDVLDTFRPAAAELGLQFDTTLRGPLPCEADPDRITQAMTNLLSNAIKFTPAGGKVSVLAERRGKVIRVEVSDTGMGLSDEQMRRLFKPFEQVHESQIRNKGGSGLGLYITHGIIDLHGGTIDVASEGPGKGSRFFFELPASDDESVAAA